MLQCGPRVTDLPGESAQTRPAKHAQIIEKLSRLAVVRYDILIVKIWGTLDHFTEVENVHARLRAVIEPIV